MTASAQHHPCRPDPTLPPGPKPSRMGRRRAVVLVLVHLAIAVHVAHWLSTGRTVSPLEPSEAMEFAKYSVVNAGLIFFSLAALSTLVLGRFFCGWACHLVALQDLCRAMLLRVGIRPRPLRSRALAWVPFIAFAYMFLWPLVVRLMEGDELGVRATALTTSDFWRTFPPWWGALATFLICGFVAVYLLGAKGFCTYGCPYGALFAATDKLSPTRIRVTEACEGCGHCTATCSSNVDVAREVHDYGMVVDSGCMKCLDCVSVCPTDALYVGLGRPALGARPRKEPKPRRRPMPGASELALGVLFIVGFFVYRGLYGLIPLLMALGLAGCLAYGWLLAWRTVRGQDCSLPGIRFVQDGTRTRAGFTLVVVMVFLAAHTVQASGVQIEGTRSARAFEHLQEARGDWFSPRRAPLDDEESTHARAVLVHARTALHTSLLPDARREAELAWAYLLTGNDMGFEEHMGRAVRFGHRPAIAHLELGNHLREKGRLEETATHYRAALDIDPGIDFAYPMLADVLVQLDRGDEVESLLRAGLKMNPRDLPLRGRLADVLVSSDRERDAIALLEEGVEVSPDDPAPLRVLAFTHLVLEEPDQAAGVIARAIELPDPDGETSRLAARINAALQAR